MESPDHDTGPTEDLADWNRRRRHFCEEAGIPLMPVRDDREAPPADEELVRKMHANDLSPEEFKRVAYLCVTYPAWIGLSTRIATENYFALRDFTAKPKSPPDLA